MRVTIDAETVLGAAREESHHLETLLDFVYQSAAGVLTPSAPDLKDAVQEAFMRVLGAIKRDSFDLNKGDITAYVRKVVLRVALDQRKRRSESWRPGAERQDLETIEDPSRVDLVEVLNKTQQLSQLAVLVDRMDEADRAVILLSRDGLSTEEISAALDIPEGTVKSRLHRAIRKLQRHANGVSLPEGQRYARSHNK